MTFAGTPAAMDPGGSDRVTTAPAATMPPSPMVTPGSTTTRAPSHTSRPIDTSSSIFAWSMTGMPGSVW